MRHRKSGSKLGKNPAHRRAVLRNLVTNVIQHMITLGKRDTLHTRRQAASFLMTPGATKKLFADIAPRFATRNGGYTRILRAGWRISDGASLAILELVGFKLKKKETKKKEKAAAAEPKAEEAKAAEVKA